MWVFGYWLCECCRSGSLVGFASCLAALCMDVRLDSRTYIKEVRVRLLTALDDFRSSEKSLEVGEHHFLVYSIVLVFMCICMYLCMYVCIYVCVCMYVCVHMY